MYIECFSVHSIILVIESVLFGLFVLAIGCDQVRFYSRFILDFFACSEYNDISDL